VASGGGRLVMQCKCETCETASERPMFGFVKLGCLLVFEGLDAGVGLPMWRRVYSEC
jgi:hypothetical protein